MEDRYSSAFDQVRASDSMKARMVDRMRQMNETEPQPVRVPQRLRKRTLTILIAAAILLIGGTALALGISAMIGTRDRAAQAVASYQAVLEGQGVPETVELPGSSVPVPSPYITYAQFQADEDGKWLPDTITDIDVTAQAGGLTVRFAELISRTEFDQLACYLVVEGAKPVPYSLSEIRMSINGGEALKTKSEMDWEQNHASSRATPEPVQDWCFDTWDDNYLTFPLAGNPLRAGNTFTLTGKLNGEAFELSPDPLAHTVCPVMEQVKLGETEDAEEIIAPLLHNDAIFGVDLYEVGMAPMVVKYFNELIAGPGAVRATLVKYVH